MGKALGAVARFVLILFIIGLVGYNTYEISRLRAEVARLRGGEKRGNAEAMGMRRSGTLEQLAGVQSHTERASALLKQKKLSEATKEMQLASDAAARASGNAQAGTRSAVADAQKSLASLSRETAALWKQAEGIAKKAGSVGDQKEPPVVSEKRNEKQSTKQE
ncbi:MAG: hypothetical protein H7145_14800 [Akkermansiaceae bacterium]|nr:hypothetical protein [Armatimonadota bacterium]